MTGALDQLPRLLALVPYLLARPGVPFRTVTRDFGVSAAQLRKDLNLLWVCGLPGHSPGDLIDLEFEGDTITLFEPQGVVRPLRLTADEALALVVALRTLAETPGLVESSPVLSALAKVEEAAGSAARPVGRVEVAWEGEAAALPPVRAALAAGQRLHLTYHVPARDETTERDVDPVRLVVADGRSYLEAWCRQAEGLRLFRLDRVVAAAVLDEPADPPAGLPSRDLSSGVFTPSETDLLVTLALAPGAHWVADYYPCDSVEYPGDSVEYPGDSVEPGAGDELVVRLRTPDPAWVRRLALRLGGNGRVLAPPELAEQVRADARRALAAYDEAHAEQNDGAEHNGS